MMKTIWEGIKKTIKYIGDIVKTVINTTAKVVEVTTVSIGAVLVTATMGPKVTIGILCILAIVLIILGYIGVIKIDIRIRK